MSMTALVSAFCRAYHSGRGGAKIFDDTCAAKLLTAEELRQIGGHMAAGVQFFDPNFRGNDEQALARVMDGFLSPAPLCRAAFAEECFAAGGAAQYLLLGAGYDTFACRHAAWAAGHAVFELDRDEVLADKQQRLQRAGIVLPESVRYIKADLTDPLWPETLRQAGFFAQVPTFCAAMGLSYYLTAETMAQLLEELSSLLAAGSVIALDVPTGALRVQQALAGVAGETMQAVYGWEMLAEMAAARGLRLDRWLGQADVQRRYVDPYNAASGRAPMAAPENVALCLLVK